jgi:hypothetical protein
MGNLFNNDHRLLGIFQTKPGLYLFSVLMKKFLSNILKLSTLTIIILILSLFFIPDKVSHYNLLGALIDKHTMIKKIASKKIILLGGSNISFGINSEELAKKYKKPVINMALNAGIGLEYMVNDIKPYINKGDRLILIPEYENFYTDTFYGEMELVSIVFDVEPNSKQLLNQKQWLYLLKYLPTYSAKKIKNAIPSLFNTPSDIVDVYHRNSFNEYGDAYIHWNLPNQSYSHLSPGNGREMVNEEVIQFLKKFKAFVATKDAELIIFPPVIDQTSYDNQKTIIRESEKKLKANGVSFATDPINYRYDDSFFFNSYYHLNKTGVDKRTAQLINDLDNLKSE